MLSPSAFADDIAWNGGGLNVKMGSMYGHTHVRGRGRVHIARAWAVSPRTARAHTQAQAPCTPHACTRARGRRAATRAWYEMRMSVQRRLLAPRMHARGRIRAHTPPAHKYRFHVYNVLEMLACRHATEGEAVTRTVSDCDTGCVARKEALEALPAQPLWGPQTPALQDDMVDQKDGPEESRALASVLASRGKLTA